MTNESKTYKDLIPVIVEREGATLPEGFDSWGIKSVRPDLRTHNGYKWPGEGHVAECDPARIVPESDNACPTQEGDGLCVAWTWQGMASGGIPARTLLLVAYKSDEVLGRVSDAGKLRTRSVAVVAIVDGEKLLREAGKDADLRNADLSYAYLSDADLRRANLSYAYLRSANLHGADLSSAVADQYTLWPDNFDPAEQGVVFV